MKIAQGLITWLWRACSPCRTNQRCITFKRPRGPQSVSPSAGDVVSMPCNTSHNTRFIEHILHTNSSTCCQSVQVLALVTPAALAMCTVSGAYRAATCLSKPWRCPISKGNGDSDSPINLLSAGLFCGMYGQPDFIITHRPAPPPIRSVPPHTNA